MMKFLEKIKANAFLIVAIILVLWGSFWLIYDAKTFSITSDEVVYLPVGLRYLEYGDVLLNNEHPPLFKIVSALSTLPLKPDIGPSVMEGSDNQWRFGEIFWFHTNFEKLDALLFLSRLPTVLLTIITFVSVYLWSRKNLGQWAALGALGSLVLNPNILAHGALNTNDLYLGASAWFLFVATFNFIKKIELKSALWFGAALFFVALSKYTGLIFAFIALAVVFIFMVFKKRAWKFFKNFFISLAVALILTWVTFLFVERQAVFSPEPVTLGLRTNYERQVASPIKKVILLPYGRVREGLLFTQGHNKLGHRTYLNGEITQFGWKSYFLYALWYKTPTPILILASIGLIMAIFKRNWALLGLFLSGSVGFLIGSITHIQTGIRYILFFYFVFAPLVALAVENLILWRKKVFGIAIISLLTIYLVVDLSFSWGTRMGYFSLISGGQKNGYKHLSDSNIDWGEEYHILQKYLDAHKSENIILGVATGQEPEYSSTLQNLRQFNCDNLPKDAVVIASKNFVVGFFGPYPCLLDKLKAGQAKTLGYTYFVFQDLK